MYDINKIYEILLMQNYQKELFSDLINSSSIVTGSDINVCCPLPNHNDSTPSFSISLTKPLYNCFGCGAKGDWLDYLQKTQNWDFKTALAYLADKAGVEKSNVPIVKKKIEYSYTAKEKEQKVIDFEANDAYFIKCFDNLLNHPSALKFLEEKRGIKPETAIHCGMGIDTEKQRWVIPVFKIGSLNWEDPKFWNPKILGFEYRRSDFSLFDINGKKFKCHKQPSTPSTLVEINGKSPEMRKLIIMEGFFDAYLYWQYLKENGKEHTTHIITPSCGLSRLVEDVKAFDFTPYLQVTVMLDNDYKHINVQGELENIGLNKMKELNELFPEFKYNVLPDGYKDFSEWYIGMNKKEVKIAC